MTDFSILIAHKKTKENDQALKVALECIVENTHHQYELLIDTTTPADVYALYNKLAEQARSEYVVMTNSDVFFAPDWDVPMLGHAAPDNIVTGVIIECGAIGVAQANVHKSFGMRPDNFDREAFERWVAAERPFPPGRGWYFPSLHHRASFLAMGGFNRATYLENVLRVYPDGLPNMGEYRVIGEIGRFPTSPLDMFYWDRWLEAGKNVVHVPSYSYHLQLYSSEVEQQKEIRHSG